MYEKGNKHTAISLYLHILCIFHNAINELAFMRGQGLETGN